MTDLHAEIAIGDKAKHAYDLYVKDFVERVQSQIYENFLHCPVGDNETILEIKRLSAALSALEQAILTDIETGVLASKQLAENRKH